MSFTEVVQYLLCYTVATDYYHRNRFLIPLLEVLVYVCRQYPGRYWCHRPAGGPSLILIGDRQVGRTRCSNHRPTTPFLNTTDTAAANNMRSFGTSEHVQNVDEPPTSTEPNNCCELSKFQQGVKGGDYQIFRPDFRRRMVIISYSDPEARNNATE